MEYTSKVVGLPDNSFVYHDRVYMKEIKTPYINIDGSIYRCFAESKITNDAISMSGVQRDYHHVNITTNPSATIKWKEFIGEPSVIKTLALSLSARTHVQINCEELIGNLINMDDKILVQEGRGEIIEKFNGVFIYIKVLSALSTDNSKFGLITTNTNIDFTAGNNVKLTNQVFAKTVFKADINLEKLGIGGLDEEFKSILRKVFASRLQPKKYTQEMGINPVRGLVLYGPPGCGKTLIAKQLGTMLNCKSENMQIVNGPSLLNKYVGQSEENVRNLFARAIKDQDSGELHVIICDEFDALCKTRGIHQSGSGVGDNVVNQFLSMIDGPKSLNNILLICMTNRLDLIDDAILRPGRLEVHVCIGLPDEKGRRQILKIHTSNMEKYGYLNNDVSIDELAKITNNYTGAELEGIVRDAASFAISREMDLTMQTAQTSNKPILTMDDFRRSLCEIIPMFGNISNEIEKIVQTKLILWSPSIKEIYDNVIRDIQTAKNGFVSIIAIIGVPYTGKTVLTCHCAKDSNVNCIKMIRGSQLISVSDRGKFIQTVYEQCERTHESILILDSIERIIDWSNVGSIYDNRTLQALLSTLDEKIDQKKKMVIIMTSGNKHMMERLGLLDYVDNIYETPEFVTDPIGEYAHEMNNKVSDMFKRMKYS